MENSNTLNTKQTNLHQNKLETTLYKQNELNKLKSYNINKLNENNIIITEQPIIGRAIFNNTMVEYFCDTEANVTIINKELFNQILKQAPETQIIK